MDEYRELMSELKFPLTIYRGFAFRTDINFDAREDQFDLSDEDDLEEFNSLKTAVSRIDFSRVGTSWTWDKDVAVEGGALHDMGGNGKCHLLVAAVVQARHVDLPITLIQNLTVYEEEKEVRLLPNLPIKITWANPPMWKFPIRSNTGPESWDQREHTLRDIGL